LYGFALDWWGFGVLLHEMLIGLPPFADDNRQILFRKITSEEPSFSYYDEQVSISSEAKDLINKLLVKDPKNRIKPEEIPFHPFFKKISFDDIYKRKITAPFVPKIVYIY
jgi:serine/threonine protein kinase